MPRKLTESAKKCRLEKEQRVIEKPADVPDTLKQPTIEFLYRIGKDAKEIIKFTGIRKQTVYDCINRFKETGTAAPAPRSGRPATALSAQNVTKARKIISRDPEKSQAEIAKKLGISKMSMSNLVRWKFRSRSYQVGRGPLLTDAHKQSRLEKAQRMLDFINANPDRINRVLFLMKSSSRSAVISIVRIIVRFSVASTNTDVGRQSGTRGFRKLLWFGRV